MPITLKLLIVSEIRTFTRIYQTKRKRKFTLLDTIPGVLTSSWDIKLWGGVENCSLKSTHNTRRDENCSLKSTHNTRRYENCSLAHTHNTRWYKNCSRQDTHNTRWCEYILRTLQWGRWNPGGLVLYQASGAASILTESRPSPRDSREDSSEGQSSSPAVIPGGWGQRRSKRRAVQFQGIPGGVARGSVPERVATSRSTPVGSKRRWCDLKSFVYARVAWWTAITKSNLVFVYNQSLPDFCLYQVISKILFIPGHC